MSNCLLERPEHDKWLTETPGTPEILQMSRTKVKKAMDLLTGHYLNKHLHIIGVIEDLIYSAWCKDEEESQYALSEYLILRSIPRRTVPTTSERMKEPPIINALKFIEYTMLME